MLENLQMGAAGARSSRLRRELDFVLSVFPELRPCIHAKAAKLPSTLQRFVMFARGVMCAPRLLVLDQPSFGLCAEQADRLFRAISRTKREYGMALLIVEQNLFQALKLSDAAFWMDRGRIIGERSAVELLADRRLQMKFLRSSWQVQEDVIGP